MNQAASAATALRRKGVRRFSSAQQRLHFVILLAAILPSCALLNNNLRTVEEGEFYRSGQMPPERLASVAMNRGIKTIVSLRSVQEGEAWRDDEIAVCGKLGIARFDVPLSRDQLPPPDALKVLAGIFQNAEKPILVHCQGGTHRAGTAAAIYELLRGKTVDEARKQFTLFFDDAPIGEVVEMYRESSLPFDRWIEEEYPALYDQHVTPQTPE